MRIEPINPPLREGQRVYCARCGSGKASLASLDERPGTFYCAECAVVVASGPHEERGEEAKP